MNLTTKFTFSFFFKAYIPVFWSRREWRLLLWCCDCIWRCGKRGGNWSDFCFLTYFGDGLFLLWLSLALFHSLKSSLPLEYQVMLQVLASVPWKILAGISASVPLTKAKTHWTEQFCVLKFCMKFRAGFMKNNFCSNDQTQKAPNKSPFWSPIVLHSRWMFL